jgi:hypothetical protein
MKKTKGQNGKLRIPLEFQAAVSSFLKVKPEPKKKPSGKRK